MAQLPAEVWLHICGHLSAADKLSVRASCKYFKRLVDQASLWRHWTVVLTFKRGPYHPQFWASLRRRRVSSAVVRSDKAKHWKQLALSLPALSSVVLEHSSPVSPCCLRDFPQLRRVAVRSRGGAVRLDPPAAIWPQQLTHLSLCGVTFHPSSVHHFVGDVSRLTALTSLTCHSQAGIEDPLSVITDVLSHLPQLKHLSVSVTPPLCHFRTAHGPTPRLHGDTSSRAADLSSLELIGCWDRSLPEDVMRLVPGLSRLALFYEKSHHDASEEWSTGGCRLQTWLRDLPHLSVLVVVRGPPVWMYAASLPAAVTSLTLCVARLTPEDLAAAALQVPNLLHLHVDPWPSHLGADTAKIPRFFPKLRSLKLRHEHVPEKDFLLLLQLRDLEHLEILDDHPRLSKLIRKLQALTQYRVDVTATRRPRDVLSCPCVEQVY